MSYAYGGDSPLTATIPTVDFKDKFFPGLHWTRSQQNMVDNSQGAKSIASSALESRTESMHVDNMLAGKKFDDVIQDKMREEEMRIKEKEKLYSKGHLQPIKEDRFEVMSQSSVPSRAIDDILDRSIDPRRDKNAKSFARQTPGSSFAIGKGGLNDTQFSGGDILKKFKVNQDYYRQNEAIIR